MISDPKPLTLPCAGFSEILAEATESGHKFVARFFARYQSGEFVFDQPGECLLGVWDDTTLVAFGGLCRDPYAATPNIGRLRHLYILGDFRGCGIGKSIVEAALARNTTFSEVRLRAGTDAAGRFYDHLGWQRTDAPNATHSMAFDLN